MIPLAASRSARAEITVCAGDVVASAEPAIIRTLLGSCVAVCLWDPHARIGGMNHFMLPDTTGRAAGDDAARFGVHAMDRLICEMMKTGARRSRMRAKVFGGAHVLRTVSDSVPRRNNAFILDFLARDGVPIAGEDLGGTLPRQLRFETDTGSALVRRVISGRLMAQIAHTERRQRAVDPEYGAVTLF